MKRVLQVLGSLEINGGVQAVIMNTYRKIDKTKIQFDFAAYEVPPENCFREEIESLGGHVIKIDGLSAAGPVRFYKQFVELLSQSNYAAVHAHNIHHNGLILLAAKRSGIQNRISHGHQAFDEYNNTFFRKCFAHALMWLNKRVATKQVACSDLAASFLYGKRSKYIFIPNAIDVSRYEELPSKRELREKFGVPAGKILAVHIGRMAPPKNQMFLIDIMKSLKNSDVVLWLVGNGPLREETLSKVQEEHLEASVKYLGIRYDCPEILGAADVMLLPSIYEGLPVVAVEAQAAGCYSLISENVSKQTDLGLGLVRFLPIDSSQRWADEIKRTHLNTRSNSGIENLQIQIRRLGFGIDENIRMWNQLYN